MFIPSLEIVCRPKEDLWRSLLQPTQTVLSNFFCFVFISKAGLVNKMLLILEINEKFHFSIVEPGLISLQENSALRHGQFIARSLSRIKIVPLTLITLVLNGFAKVNILFMVIKCLCALEQHTFDLNYLNVVRNFIFKQLGQACQLK